MRAGNADGAARARDQAHGHLGQAEGGIGVGGHVVGVGGQFHAGPHAAALDHDPGLGGQAVDPEGGAAN